MLWIMREYKAELKIAWKEHIWETAWMNWQDFGLDWRGEYLGRSQELKISSDVTGLEDLTAKLYRWL